MRINKTRPNVILIVADDMGYGDPGCYGGWIETPNIDRLAAEGMRFTDFHSSGAVCSPTRAGLLTGRYQQRAGIDGVITAANHRHVGLDPKEVTMSRLLQLNGYATAVFGKWHLGYDPKFNPVRHGFDTFKGYVSGNVDYMSHIDQSGYADWWDGDRLEDEPGYVTHLVTDHAVKFIQDHQDRPFFLYVAHEAPHYPYQGPRDLADRVVGGTFPAQGSREDKKEAYREMVEEMDKGIGQIIQTLEAGGIKENTMIVFFSDNGGVPLGSNGNLRGFKGDLWEGGHRVPAIWYWPGRLQADAVCAEAVISLDIMPTVLEFCQTPVPQGRQLDGVSITSLLIQMRNIDERALFWKSGNRLAARSGNWKLVIHDIRQPEPELYDLSADIGEQHNVREREPEVYAELSQALTEWLRDVCPAEVWPV